MLKLKDNELKKIALDEFHRALDDFYNPFIPEPNILHDPKRVIGFYIDPQDDWKITLNVAELPGFLNDPIETRLFLREICRHEISHYMICPSDAVTNILMISSARKIAKDPELGNLIANIVTDIIIDVERNKLFPGEPIWLDLVTLKSIKENNKEISPLVLLMERVKEILWNETSKLEFNEYLKDLLKKHGLVEKYFKNEIKLLDALSLKASELEQDAIKISKFIKKNLFNRESWPRLVEDVAKILLKHVPQNEMQMTQLISQASEIFHSDCTGLPMRMPKLDDEEEKEKLIDEISSFARNPEDIERGLEIIEELTPQRQEKERKKDASVAGDKTSDTTREKQKKKEKSKKKRKGGGTKKQRGKQGGAGIKKSKKIISLKALRYWYRSISKDHVKIKIKEKKKSGAIPVSIDTWNLSDKIEELDVQASMASFPKLLPGLTTKKWNKQDVFGQVTSKHLPDLLLVIDSSGSMNWHYSRRNLTNPYHVALIGAFGALDVAMKRDALASVINFSGSATVVKWTRDRVLLENALLAYRGGGTIFPNVQLKELVRLHERNWPNRKILLVLITDAELANWSTTMHVIERILKAKHHVAFFHISNVKNKNLEKLGRDGAIIHQITRPQDLAGLIIAETKRIYEQQVQ